MNNSTELFLTLYIISSPTIFCAEKEHKKWSCEEALKSFKASGDTLLIAAARADSIDMVEALLKAKADIDQQNKSGTTALLYAIDSNHIPVAKKLLYAGANPNITDHRGATPLMIANRSKELVTLLLASKADCCRRTDVAGTALMQAMLNLFVGNVPDELYKDRAHVIKMLHLYDPTHPAIESYPHTFSYTLDQDRGGGKFTCKYTNTVTDEEAKKIKHDIEQEEAALKAAKEKREEA